MGSIRQVGSAELAKLYWEEGKTLSKIAELFGVSDSTVFEKFKRLGIPRRKWYEWHSADVNLEEPTPELSYVLGVLLGDGYAHHNQIRLRVTDKSFAESFYNALEKIGFHPKIRIVENGGWGKKPLFQVVGNSKKFVDWFSGLSLDDVKNLAMYDKETAKEFIRGFYESEGWASRAGMCNTNRELLEKAKEILESLGFKMYIGGPYFTREGCKQIFMLYPARSQINDFHRFINPCIKNIGG